jgi:metal-responsive CopG/Arc/MetJ family transcriptional regulator
MAVPRRQTLVPLNDELVAALDRRAVATRRSRSDLIREAIEHDLRDAAADAADRRIVRGYRRIPQEDDPRAEALARESIAAEPW